MDLRRAELRRLDGPRRDGLAGRRAGRAPADARRDRAALHRGPRPRALRRPGRRGAHRAAVSSTPTRSSCAIDPRRLPALAPMRRSARCPRSRPWSCHLGLVGDGAGPAARGGPARRPDDRAAHRRPGARGRPRVDAPRPGQARRGHRHRPAAVRDPGPRPRRGPGRPVAPRPGRGVGRFAVRRALAGPQHGHPPARPHAPRCPASTRPARTPPPAPACRRSASPPRWWRSRSARPERAALRR